MTATPTILYRKSTGEIISTGGIQFESGHEDTQIAAAIAPWGDDVGLVVGSGNKETHYVAIIDEQAVIADRPPLVVRTQDDRTTLAADGEDSIALTGLPNPCEIIIDAADPDVETEIISVAGGGFVFVADDPGVYTVEVRRWPFLPFRIEFTAT